VKNYYVHKESRATHLIGHEIFEKPYLPFTLYIMDG